MKVHVHEIDDKDCLHDSSGLKKINYPLLNYSYFAFSREYSETTRLHVLTNVFSKTN